MRIILASASRGRQGVLEQLGLEFEIIPSVIEEELDESREFHEALQLLALRKAREVSQRVGDDALVLGADTLAVGDRIYGKPADDESAVEMLKDLQGKSHSVITGIALVKGDCSRWITAYEKTTLTLKPMSDWEIWDYVHTGEPIGKAGGYALQGQASRFIAQVKGSITNIIGLPLEKLVPMLMAFGLNII